MFTVERKGHSPGFPEDGQVALPSKALTVILPQALFLQPLLQGSPKALSVLLTGPGRGAMPTPGIVRTGVVLGAGPLHSRNPAQPASGATWFPNMEAASHPGVGQGRVK